MKFAALILLLLFLFAQSSKRNWLFSSDGRTIATEIAKIATQRCSSLCFGAKCSDGICLITRNKLVESDKLLEKIITNAKGKNVSEIFANLKKKRRFVSSTRWMTIPNHIHRISKDIFVLFTGRHADNMQLLDMLKNRTLSYYEEYGQEIQLANLVEDVAFTLWQRSLGNVPLPFSYCILSDRKGNLGSLTFDGTYQFQSMLINIPINRKCNRQTDFIGSLNSDLDSVDSTQNNSEDDEDIPYGLHHSQYEALQQWLSHNATTNHNNYTCTSMRQKFLEEVLLLQSSAIQLPEEEGAYLFESLLFYANGTTVHEFC